MFSRYILPVIRVTNQHAIDVASERGVGQTRKQHQFGCPVVVSKKIAKDGHSATYALTGLKMNLEAGQKSALYLSLLVG